LNRKHALVLASALLLVSCETPLRSAAATAQVAPRLPNALFGQLWCFRSVHFEDPYLISPDNDPDDPDHGFDVCANRGGVRFWRGVGKWGYQLGRFEQRIDCEIRKVTRVGRRYPFVNGKPCTNVTGEAP
jgi:hypothetical protein